MSVWDNGDPAFAEWDWVHWFPYTPWIPIDPQEETEDMSYPAASINPFTEVLHIYSSIEPYFQVEDSLSIAS